MSVVRSNILAKFIYNYEHKYYIKTKFEISNNMICQWEINIHLKD